MKTINSFFKFGFVLTISSFMISCTGNSNSEDKARIAKLEAQIEQLQSNQTTNSSSSYNSSSHFSSSHSEEK
ncbi:MAG: hypothetical protein J6Y79_01260, partial [Paludibacteraceae bacterium]|nr:hypothetical protein [Paludibacteraceae bacterium]